MAPPTDGGPDRLSEPFSAQFERRWGHLTRPHVRALAWLLDAPDLLDAASGYWGGRIASLGALGPEVAGWLAALERDPAALDAALGPRPYSRLGLYAEKLLAFYFARQGVLAAHSLQVRASRTDTVGEFDFLLRQGDALLHWELATKFYLLIGAPYGEPGGASDDERLDALVGPNLADTLGRKMHKILDKQLVLARHPAAQSLLPQAVAGAQALVKGWLFYPDDAAPRMAGIAPDHNHGFWSTLAQVEGLAGERWLIVPRLQWLAPVKMAAGDDTAALSRAALRQELAARFALASSPLLVACVREEGGWWLESRRGFIVPDDWPERAAAGRAGGG
jgi:uncharacterized protein